MSGAGRRRKPNPEEEGGLPTPPRPPAGYQQPAYQPEQQQYAYDWRESASAPDATQTGQQGQGPGPVFDAFSAGPAAPRSAPQTDTSGYYNPVGYGLQDPYSPTAYGAPQASPAPPQAQPQAQPQAPSDTSSFPRQMPFGTQQAASHPPAPAQAPASSFSGPAQRPADQSGSGGLFDENDLFDSGTFSTSSSSLSASATSALSSSGISAPLPDAPSPLDGTGMNPVVPPLAEGAPRPNDGYSASDFAFLEEETGQDVNSWLTFVETRADSRADRSRRFRMRLIGVGVAVAVVGAGVGGYVLFGGGGLLSNNPTKSVVLLQLSDPTGNAAADALLVADRSPSASPTSAAAKTVSGHGAAVLIPSQMVVNTTGFGSQPFGGNMAQSVPAAGKDTIADTLGVSIDGVWRMDEVTFAGLVDELGGIQVNTNTAVPAVNATPSAAAIPQGNDKLTGGQAVAYGTYAAKGESPTAQSQRFGQVVAGLLSALPTDSGAITAYLNHLGIVDDPSLPESKLSPILAVLAGQEQGGAFTAKVLPLRNDGSDAMDAQAAAPIVTSLLGGAVAAESPGQVNRVLVEDASGHTGLQSQTVRGAAQAKLENSGYTFIDGSSISRRATSVVEIGSGDKKDAAVQIAETLGLQAGNVQVVSGLSTFSDVTVILGADWPKAAGVQLGG
ncbi:MAG: LCP family protein [Actinocrinis sp.]